MVVNTKKFFTPKINELYCFFSSADMWGLGCLIWEVFNGPLHKQSSLKELAKVNINIFSQLVILKTFNYRYQNN